MTREQKLAKALEELSGYSRRNSERANKAFMEVFKQMERGHVNEEFLELRARAHEAENVRLVVETRVKEALLTHDD